MSRYKSWPARVARSLAAHLDRLRNTLDRLHGQLREAVTEALGGSAAAAAKDAVRAALLGNAFASAGNGRSYRSASPTWEEPNDRDDPWNEREADYRSAYWKRESYGDDAEPYQPNEQPDSAPTMSAPTADTRVRRWGLALAAGCQAAAWWLRRQTGRYTMLAALGVGLASGTAAYVAGPAIVAGTALAESALNLTALSAAAHAGYGALSGGGAR